MSVLFVDLVGFTPFAERLDADDVREIQAAYFEAARAVIAQQDGTLEKFIGDAVMAVWGTPVSRENDSDRAVHAGLAVLAAVGRLGAGGEGLRARAAVVTGEAAVTLPATGQGLVAGDLVNAAARLQQLATAGELLVDATTAQLVSGIELEAAGERRLKGRRQPMQVYRAVAGADRRRRAGRHRGPFVGRDAELDQLVGLVSRVADHPAPTSVLLIGIAGIGKSRLVWEVQRSVHHAQPSLRWLATRASGYDDAATYAPFADIVGRLLRLRDPAPGAAKRAVRSFVKRLSADQSERVWLTAALDSLLVSEVGADVDRSDLFSAWRRFLELATEAGPCVLVIEDLQWARPEMVELVDWLMAGKSGRYAMVVVARPELTLLPKAGASVETLHLPALGDDVMDRLLATLAPGLTPQARVAVRRRADGVPLYAVELARMLQDRADLGAEADELNPADLPASLRALISARIDELPARPRATLLAASVLGQSFALDALADIVGSTDDVATSLPVLVEREFVTAEGLAHAFVQGLVREVALRTVGRRARRGLDLAAADYYGPRGPLAVASVAEHLWSAHRATRGEVDGPALAERAGASLAEAADAALRGAAPRTALDFLERALTIAASVERTAMLHQRAGTAARLAANLGLAESHLRRAIALRTSLGDAGAGARATAELAGVLLLEQHNDDALRELEVAWRAASDSVDTGMAELAGQLARVHAINGNDEAAIEWADRALTMNELSPRPSLTTGLEAQVTRGTARAGAGDQRGLGELREAAAAAAKAGLPSVELRALNNLSWLLVTDDPRASADSARRALELARRVGAGEMALQLSNVASTASIETGDWQQARAGLDEMLDSDAEAAYRTDAAIARAVIAALAGEPDPGRHIARLGRLRRGIDRQQRGAIEYAQAVIEFLTTDFATALATAQAAARRLEGIDQFNALALAGRVALWAGDRAYAKRVGGRLDALPVHGRAADAQRATLRAGIAAAGANREAARLAYEVCEEMWRDLGLDVQLALAKIERARFLEPESRALRRDVRTLLRRTGAAGLEPLAEHVAARGQRA